MADLKGSGCILTLWLVKIRRFLQYTRQTGVKKILEYRDSNGIFAIVKA